VQKKTKCPKKINEFISTITVVNIIDKYINNSIIDKYINNINIVYFILNMVFYTTFKQLKYFDYFRPIDIKIFEGIANLHIHKEKLYIDNTTVNKVYNEIIKKMESKIFRFLVVECVNNDDGGGNGDGGDNDESNNGDNHKDNSCYVKLYKLSNIFQYLSVIEIFITEIKIEKENENNKEISDINIKLSGLDDSLSQYDLPESELNTPKEEKKGVKKEGRKSGSTEKKVIRDSQYNPKLIGRKLKKKFDVGIFVGVVEHYRGKGHYMIVYEDSDSEEMHVNNIMKKILPAVKTTVKSSHNNGARKEVKEGTPKIFINEKKDSKNKNENKIQIFVRSSSVSALPAFVPLGFLLSFLFYFIPFVDLGVNQKYIQELKLFLNFNDGKGMNVYDVCI
jgi:hypothetical protein